MKRPCRHRSQDEKHVSRRLWLEPTHLRLAPEAFETVVAAFDEAWEDGELGIPSPGQTIATEALAPVGEWSMHPVHAVTGSNAVTPATELVRKTATGAASSTETGRAPDPRHNRISSQRLSIPELSSNTVHVESEHLDRRGLAAHLDIRSP